MRNRRSQALLLVVFAVLLAGCPDDGEVLRICENPEIDCEDGNACTIDTCDPSIGCVRDFVNCDDRNACTTDTCDPETGCSNEVVSCDDDDECTEDSCDPASGCSNLDVSDRCDDGDVCTSDSCDPATGCVYPPISCDDGNECTAESCDATAGCNSVPVADGTECDRGLGECLNGICEPVACTTDDDCDDRDACTRDRCNLATNECVNTDISDECDDDDVCTADSCDPESGCIHEDDTQRCDDGEECTAESCDPVTGCASEPVENGTLCDEGAGACTDGVCVSTSVVEYEQSFETLDAMDVSALANDGWTVFGNVFDAGTMDFLYGYGPFVAPNDGAAFSAIVSGQGGAEQGSQQLSIYSDYNNTDHANGDIIESNVFRERMLTTADVGRRISFSFDAKRGNINDPTNPLCPCTSTAFAFIKTLDPSSGFATTNLIERDTTTIPDSWNRYELSLRIDSGLSGQLIQIGFACTATLFEPSANFYDNVEIESAGTAP